VLMGKTGSGRGMVKSTRLTQTGHGPLIGPPKSSNHAGFDLRVLNVNQYRRNGPSRAAADCLAMLGILAKAARKSPEFARRKARSDRSFCFGLVGTVPPVQTYDIDWRGDRHAAPACSDFS